MARGFSGSLKQNELYLNLLNLFSGSELVCGCFMKVWKNGHWTLMKEECVSVCGHFFFFPKRVLFHCATSQMRSCCKQLCHQGNRTSAPCFNLTTEKLGGRQTRNKRWKEENYILSPVERSQQGPEHAAKQSTTVVWNDKIL